MGGMKVSNMDFIKLLPAFMQDRTQQGREQAHR